MLVWCGGERKLGVRILTIPSAGFDECKGVVKGCEREEDDEDYSGDF